VFKPVFKVMLIFLDEMATVKVPLKMAGSKLPTRPSASTMRRKVCVTDKENAEKTLRKRGVRNWNDRVDI
jgi:hypothetical protein